MSNRSKEALDALARESAVKTYTTSITQEAIRRELALFADTAIASYREQCEANRTQGKEALSAAIIPWWQEFQSSELFDNIKNALGSGFSSHFRIQVSDAIEYFWPKHAFSDHKPRYQKPHEILAQVILDKHKHDGEGVAQRIAHHGRQYQAETWDAIATIEQWGDEKTNFYFSRWPTQGAGFAFAIASRSYHVPIAENLDTYSPRGLHPVVLTEFAAQIQSGRVWDVLHDSFARELEDK